MGRRAFPAALFWGAILAALGLFSREPDLNWDGIAYVALAMEKGGASPGAAQELAYAHLRELASADRFEELVRGSPYREGAFAKLEVFQESLGFYRMRQGYTGLLSGVHRFLGGNLFVASAWLGRAAYLLLAWVLWAWMGRVTSSGAARRGAAPRRDADIGDGELDAPGRERGPGWERLLPLVVLLQPAVLRSIPLSTPDLLAASLLGMGALYLMNRGEPWAAAFFFLLAILSRPDSLILACPLMAVPALAKWLPCRREREPIPSAAQGREALLAALLSSTLFGVGVFVVVASGAHPWSKVFHHSFIQHLLYPSEETVRVGVWEYLKVVGTAVMYLGSGKETRILFCLTFLAVAYLMWHPLVERERKLAACFVLAAWIAFFFLFPLPLERFYLAHISLAGVFLIQLLAELHASLGESLEPKLPRYLALLRGKRPPLADGLAMPPPGQVS